MSGTCMTEIRVATSHENTLAPSLATPSLIQARVQRGKHRLAALKMQPVVLAVLNLEAIGHARCFAILSLHSAEAFRGFR